METSGRYFRGGPSLSPRLDEIRVDRSTGWLRPTHGVSVYDNPNEPNVRDHGGAYLVGPIPSTLRIIQRGGNPRHFEIVPDLASQITFREYELLLGLIPLTKFVASDEG